MRMLVATAVLLSVLATGLVSVRLHAEVMRLRYDISGMERERDRLGGEWRRAAAELERARAPRALFRLRARAAGDPTAVPAIDDADADDAETFEEAGDPR